MSERVPNESPPPRRMMAPRAMAGLVMAALFAVGVAAGAALDRGILHGGRPRHEDRGFVPGAPPPRAGGGPPSGDHRRPPSMDKFAQALDLTPGQTAQVDSVMTQDFAAIRALRAAMQPSVDSIVSGTRQRIDSILTPAQREKYRALIAEQEKRMARGLGPGARR